MEDADGEEMVILVESVNQHVVAMNADGVKVTDGTNSGNKLTMAGGGLTLEDANGNKVIIGSTAI